MMVNNDNKIFDAEAEIFGCSHAEAGAWFIEDANLPVEIIMPMLYHHNPLSADNCKDIVWIVSLAEALSGRFGPKKECDGIWMHEHEVIQAKLSLKEDDIIGISEKFFETEPDMLNFYR